MFLLPSLCDHKVPNKSNTHHLFLLHSHFNMSDLFPQPEKGEFLLEKLCEHYDASTDIHKAAKAIIDLARSCVKEDRYISKRPNRSEAYEKRSGQIYHEVYKAFDRLDLRLSKSLGPKDIKDRIDFKQASDISRVLEALKTKAIAVSFRGVFCPRHKLIDTVYSRIRLKQNNLDLTHYQNHCQMAKQVNMLVEWTERETFTFQCIEVIHEIPNPIQIIFCFPSSILFLSLVRFRLSFLAYRMIVLEGSYPALLTHWGSHFIDFSPLFFLF